MFTPDTAKRTPEPAKMLANIENIAIHILNTAFYTSSHAQTPLNSKAHPTKSLCKESFVSCWEFPGSGSTCEIPRDWSNVALFFFLKNFLKTQASNLFIMDKKPTCLSALRQLPCPHQA